MDADLLRMPLVVCSPSQYLLCSGSCRCLATLPLRVQLGALVGNVRDESGGAVPGATVTALEVRTNISRTTVSNDAGNYTFTNLASGVYRIEGELVGFRKFTRDNVDVSVNTTVRVDIALTVRELEESVTVTGEAPMLQTDRTDTGRIIESTKSRSCRWDSTGTSRPCSSRCRARRGRSATFGVLQRAGQPVEQRQRPGAGPE